MDRTDIIITQYMISPIYFRFRISKTKPAARPLSASNRRGHCPISVPPAWRRVTALSSVLNTHAISTTSSASIMPAVRFFRVREMSVSDFEAKAAVSVISMRLWPACLVRMTSRLKAARNTERNAASATSRLTRLLFAYWSRIPRA